MPQAKYGYPKKFLKTISQIESSGGQNYAHPEVHAGIQAGTSGIGRYGLMPNTVKELINRRRQSGTMTPELQDIDSMPPEQIKAHLEANPGLEDQLAEGLATHVLQRQMGDEDKAAYSWTMGHNTPNQQITPDKLNDLTTKGGQYVDKFRKIKELLNKQKPEDDEI